MSSRRRKSHSFKKRKSTKLSRRYRSTQSHPVRSGPFDYQCVATTNGRFTTRAGCEHMLEGIVNGGAAPAEVVEANEGEVPRGEKTVEANEGEVPRERIMRMKIPQVVDDNHRPPQTEFSNLAVRVIRFKA